MGFNNHHKSCIVRVFFLTTKPILLHAVSSSCTSQPTVPKMWLIERKALPGSFHGLQ